MSKLLALTLAGLLGASLTACESVPERDYLAEARQNNLALLEQIKRDLANGTRTPQSAARSRDLLAESFAASERTDALLRQLRSDRESREARDWWFLQQQQQRRNFNRQLQQQQQQNLNLQMQRNWALQHQYRQPIPPPLYNPSPVWITP